MRKPSAERLIDFLDTAVRLFIAKGYRRTQMSDVTEALGLSAGSIYRYFESKQALFDLALRHAVAPRELGDPVLPHPTPPKGATLDFLREMLAVHARIESLEAALAAGPAGDPRGELEGIVRELYARTSRHRHALNLVERCALDRPDLAVLWFEETRRRIIRQLESYLEDRSRRGFLRPLPDALAVAGLIVEVVVFQAVRRLEDPYPTPMDEATAEETAVDNIVHAYLAGPEAKPRSSGS